MPHQVGDHLAGAPIGAATALAMRGAVWPGMDMVLAMLIGWGPRRRRVARSGLPARAGAGRHRWTNSHVGARPQQRHRPVGNHDGRHEPAHAQIRTRSSIGTPSATSRRRASGLRRIENVHLDIVRTSEAVKAGALKAAAAPAADHWVVLTERMTV